MNITNESVFVSALRGFLKSFAVVFGIILAFFIVLIGFALFSKNNLNLPDKSKLTVAPDAKWTRKLESSTTPVILRINVDGVIGTSNLKSKKFKDMLVDSRDGTLANNRVKGILLQINSPGGTATDSDDIYHLLKKYKENFKVPIYAFVDGLCASGGVYIACAADQIHATEDSIIGSVGVRMGPAFNFADTMEKIGVKALTLTEGKNKDALNPFRPWKEGEESSLQAVIADGYKNFVNVVTTERKNLDREKLVSEYGANIFSAPKAAELGYIDNAQADYDSTLLALLNAAGIKENEKYQVVDIEPSEPLLQGLLQNSFNLLNGKIHHVFPTGPFTNSEMSGQILYLYQP